MANVRFADAVPSPLPSRESRPTPAAAEAGAEDGYVEICGRSEQAGGWLVGGWSRRRWSERSPEAVSLRFTDGAVVTDSTSPAGSLACFFPRGDLRPGCVGFLMILRGPEAPTGRLLEMAVAFGDQVLRLRPAVATLPLEPAGLHAAAERLAHGLESVEARARLRAWLHPPRFNGTDTLARPDRPLRLEIEASLLAPPAGLVLMGWLDDPTSSIAALHVRCGDRVAELDETNWWHIPRQDVLAGLGEALTDGGPDRGFVAFLPGLLQPGTAACVQVSFTDGEVAHQPVPPPTIAGLAALRRLLGAIHLPTAALGRGMDRVVGPAVEALNTARLRVRPALRALAFGAAPATPRCSIIVHLDGPTDDLEWQLALLSETAHQDVEFLYVQDIPGLAGEVERRAGTCPDRFGLPLRLLLLDRAVGPAPAWNLAAERATGRSLCFLDRRAIPDGRRWLQRLLDDLDAEPKPGALSGWLRPAGAAASAGHDTMPAPGAGGACLVMPREVFMSVGGFDEAFALGQWAHDDLVRRLHRRGLDCRVRADVTLTLLDRTPGLPPLWQRNLALYNAWQFGRRWPEAAR